MKDISSSNNNKYQPLDIRCPHQQKTAKGLECKLTEFFPGHTTRRTTAEVCRMCPIGRVFRELGCNFVGGRVTIVEINFIGSPHPNYDLINSRIYCMKLQRDVDPDFCFKCPYTTLPIIQETMIEAQSVFNRLGFEETDKLLRQCVEQFHASLYNECISSAKASVESCLRTLLLKLNVKINNRMNLSDLWQLAKKNLALENLSTGEAIKQITSGLTSIIQGISTLRNELGIDHGRVQTPIALQSQAKLALTSATSICLFLVTRFDEIKPAICR